MINMLTQSDERPLFQQLAEERPELLGQVLMISDVQALGRLCQTASWLGRVVGQSDEAWEAALARQGYLTTANLGLPSCWNAQQKLKAVHTTLARLQEEKKQLEKELDADGSTARGLANLAAWIKGPDRKQIKGHAAFHPMGSH